MRFSVRLILAGSLMSVLLLGVSVNSAPAAKKAAAISQLIKELRQTHKIVEDADHDYDGHRAKAAHEIHAAIHTLLPHAENAEKAAEKATEKAEKSATKPAGGLKEPQEVSDAQLRQAMKNLQGIQEQLGSIKGEHATKATADVEKAISELKTALKIK